MPDLNELLRWSIENSTQAAPAANEPLSLRFNPSSTSSGTSALHPSDPLYRTTQSAADDASPASTPGPSTPDGTSNALPAIAKRNDLNTDILDVIMGKSDSVTMKEKMEFALNEENDVEDRVGALDDLEMLIELIDNANNMAVLKLWEPLLSLLNSPHEEITAHACWIMGTAIQNNLKAQAAFFLHDALPHVLPIIHSPSSSSQTYSTSTRSRATYCLSSSLKHWPLASSVLSSSSDQGYSVLSAGVKDQAVQIRRKMAFLINTLVLQSDEKYTGEIPSEVQALLEERMKELGADGKSESLIEGLKRTGVFKNLIGTLKGSEDVEVEENAMRALVAASQKGGLEIEEVEELKSVWKKWGQTGQEERGLAGKDGENISEALR